MNAAWVALPLLLLVASPPAPAGDNATAENVSPAPLAPSGETFYATDLPLDPSGDDERMAQRLAWFEPSPQRFAYKLKLVEEAETFRVYRLTYPSPLKTPWPENDIVPAEYYVPRAATARAKAPAAVVLDILDGSAILPRMMARAAAQNGLAALYVPMPCYNGRRPPGDPHRKLLREDPAKTVDGLRQTVLDVRRAKAILACCPEVDAQQIGVTGISLGGITAALSAGVDGGFARVVPILAGGDLADITFQCHEMRKLRAALLEKGVTRDAAAGLFAPVEPLNFASRINPGRCLMINAERDEVIPRNDTERLSRAVGGAQVVWLPATHYSALTYFPLMQRTVIDFLRDGKRPSVGQ